MKDVLGRCRILVMDDNMENKYFMIPRAAYGKLEDVKDWAVLGAICYHSNMVKDGTGLVLDESDDRIRRGIGLQKGNRLDVQESIKRLEEHNLIRKINCSEGYYDVAINYKKGDNVAYVKVYYTDYVTLRRKQSRSRYAMQAIYLAVLSGLYEGMDNDNIKYYIYRDTQTYLSLVLNIDRKTVYRNMSELCDMNLLASITMKRRMANSADRFISRYEHVDKLVKFTNKLIVGIGSEYTKIIDYSFDKEEKE